ncbi:MAG: protein-S-isoprenylcysteine O-methyltransferase [Anaerolineales bacterium]
MDWSLFKLIYLIELVAITIVRSLSTTKYRQLKTEEDRTTRLDVSLLVFSGVGMILPLFYIFTDWLDFANYSLPAWVGWLGAALFAGAIALLGITHRALGPSWTPTLGLRKDHQLVTGGVFKYIRHPMYAAHLLWAIAQPMLLHNWIAGFSFLVVALPQYLLRVEAEEEMMLDSFGEEYADYMEDTGRIFPRKFSGE